MPSNQAFGLSHPIEPVWWSLLQRGSLGSISEASLRQMIPAASDGERSDTAHGAGIGVSERRRRSDTGPPAPPMAVAGGRPRREHRRSIGLDRSALPETSEVRSEQLRSQPHELSAIVTPGAEDRTATRSAVEPGRLSRFGKVRSPNPTSAAVHDEIPSSREDPDRHRGRDDRPSGPDRRGFATRRVALTGTDVTAPGGPSRHSKEARLARVHRVARSADRSSFGYGIGPEVPNSRNYGADDSNV